MHVPQKARRYVYNTAPSAVLVLVLTIHLAPNTLVGRIFLSLLANIGAMVMVGTCPTPQFLSDPPPSIPLSSL